MLFGSLLLAALVGNLLLFVPPIQSVSKCIQLKEKLEFNCPWDSKQFINSPSAASPPSSETEDDIENFAPLAIPKCFEKKAEKKSKFGPTATSSLSAQSKPSKILSFRFKDCRIKCRKGYNKTSNLRWRDRNANEFSGPGFCLISEEFEEENCFSLNETLSNQLQLSLDLSMNSLPTLNQFHSVIHSINLESELTVKNKSNNRYQRIHCAGASIDDCKIVCSIEKSTMLPSMQQIKVIDKRSHLITFWSYLCLRVILIIIIATEMSLLKAAILTMVNSNASEYGYQRVWASYAVCVIPLVSGIIMDKLISNGSSQTFSPCFYLFSGLKVIMAFVAFGLKLDLVAPSAAIFSKVRELAKRPEVSIFLFYAAFIGMC